MSKPDEVPDRDEDHLDMAERMFTLRPLDLFAQLEESDVMQVARLLTSRIYAEGEEIISRGATDNDVFIVKTGTVRIEEGDRVLATLGPGAVLGELAAIDPAPRSVTVRADESCHLYHLPARAFLSLIDERFEIARGILAMLCRRLRRRIGQTTEGVVRY